MPAELAPPPPALSTKKQLCSTFVPNRGVQHGQAPAARFLSSDTDDETGPVIAKPRRPINPPGQSSACC